MGEGKKGMFEVSKIVMTAALSAEHQRKWDDSKWDCKLDDPERNYDKSRVHLNFEVRKGAVVAPVDKTVCIKGKVDKRIAEWMDKQTAIRGKPPVLHSTQHRSVNLIMGGNRERMNELAFGNQELQERGNNAHIKRMPEIEQFAIENYNALAKKIGEENIISFIVHCDEKNCHVHATITPILPDGRLSAKDMFGGGSKVAASEKMREWHDWYASVNEKWGLERVDDIHETGARHKSLEEHNRELHRENKSLEEELETKRRAVKGLTTMIEKLSDQRKDIETEIESLEAQLQKSGSDKNEIAQEIFALHMKLASVNEKLEEKHDKLNKVHQEIENLKESYDSRMEKVNDAIESDKLITNYLNHHISIMLKASILDQVLTDAARICRESRDATALAEGTFIDDRNFLRWNDVLKTGMQVFMAGINGATSVAQTSRGAGTTSDMPWREKDEDYLHWAWRAMQYAHAKHYPGNKLRKSKGY